MFSFACYLIAAICFLFAFFDRTLDGHSLIALGLLFVSLAHMLRHELMTIYVRDRARR